MAATAAASAMDGFGDTLIVLPWPDPVVEEIGHDPRSPYVEQFWLGILGPSTTWLLRRFARGLEHYPDGFELDLAETASELGLVNQGGKHNPFQRALSRCVMFGAARPDPYGLAVRRRLPPLSERHLSRLPAALQAAHSAWIGDGAADRHRHDQDRARGLALSLLELGDDVETVERQLVALGHRPLIAADALRWATSQWYTPEPAA
jgi:hypothetical protein